MNIISTGKIRYILLPYFEGHNLTPIVASIVAAALIFFIYYRQELTILSFKKSLIVAFTFPFSIVFFILLPVLILIDSTNNTLQYLVYLIVIEPHAYPILILNIIVIYEIIFRKYVMQHYLKLFSLLVFHCIGYVAPGP